MKKNNLIISILVILIIVYILSYIGLTITGFDVLEINLTSSSNLPQEVIDAIGDNEEVKIIVLLKEDEQYEIKGSQRKEYIKALQKEVLSEAKGFDLKSSYTIINAFAGKADKKALKRLQDNPEVKKIYLDKKIYAYLDESLPIIRADYIQSAKVNDINLRGNGQTICVIDTGINYNHEDLGNGWNNLVIGGYDFVNNDTDPIDDDGHGTHIAGVIASSNDIYKGISPDVKLIAIKSLDSNGTGDTSDIISGIEWCVDNASLYNISVISMSLGDMGEYDSSTCPNIFDNAIDNAIANNLFVAVASGNDGHSNGISAPACSFNATAVGATDKSDNVWERTNSGNLLDLLAPGVDIESLNLDEGTITKTGTSIAAPHVAGTAAIIYQYSALKNRSITPEEIQNKLNNTGEIITDSKNNLTFSRINLEEAILESKIIIWDEADEDMPYFEDAARVNETSIFFFANYTNRTSDEIINNADCYISFEESGDYMVYNSTKDLFEYERNFSLTRIYSYNITCNHSDFEEISGKADIDIIRNSENCTYPGSNINWNINETQSVFCLSENIILNKSNLNIKGNATLIIENSEIILIDAAVDYTINVSEDANITIKNSVIKSNVVGREINLEIYSYGDLYNLTMMENSEIYIYGNKTHIIEDSTFNDMVYLREDSITNIIDSNFLSGSQIYFEDFSKSNIQNSSFKDLVRFGVGAGDNPIINVQNSEFDNLIFLQFNTTIYFNQPRSNLTNQILALNTPLIHGYVDMPPIGSIITGNLTRYYPVQVYYNDNMTLAPNKEMNITDKNGNLIWTGVTDNLGFVNVPLILNSSNYGSGNFTIQVNPSEDISLLTDTPIIFSIFESPPSGGNTNGGGSSKCIPKWQCTEWTTCLQGTRLRTCIDLNNCNNNESKPIEQESCSTSSGSSKSSSSSSTKSSSTSQQIEQEQPLPIIDNQNCPIPWLIIILLIIITGLYIKLTYKYDKQEEILMSDINELRRINRYRLLLIIINLFVIITLFIHKCLDYQWFKSFLVILGFVIIVLLPISIIRQKQLLEPKKTKKQTPKKTKKESKKKHKK